MNHMPSISRRMNGKVVDNDRSMTEYFQKYLVGTDGNHKVNPEKLSAAANGTSRIVPWKGELDDKMFYL